MIPNDTILAKFVRSFGDSVLSLLMTKLYPSPIFKLIFFTAAVAMFLYTAWSLYEGRLKSYVIIFWVTWFSSMSYNGKPVLYVAINSFSSMITLQLQKVTFDLMAHYGRKNSYPPGFVAKTVIQAAATKITDRGLSRAINIVIDNCIPVGTLTDKNGNKRAINASDLFRAKVIGGATTGMNFSVPIDPNLLKRRSLKIDGLKTDCHKFLMATLSKLYRHVKSKGVGKVGKELYVGPANGELESKWIDSWKNKKFRDTDLGKVGLNLAAASAIQSQILNSYFGIDLGDLKSTGSSGNTAPLVELQKRLMVMSDKSETKIAFNIMNSPNSLLRHLNADQFLSQASNLVDLNEKLVSLPYYISTVLIFLKIIVIFVIISPLVLRSWKFVNLWAAAYTTALIAPWILMISRIILNLILAHNINLKKSITSFSSDPAFLKTGLDFSAATNILSDVGRFLAVYVEVEKALIQSLFIIVPVISWFAAGAVGNATSSIGQNMSRSFQNWTQNKVGQGLKGVKNLVVSKISPSSAVASVLKEKFSSSGNGGVSSKNSDKANKDYLNSIRHL